MAAAQPERAALKIPRGRKRRGEIDYLTLSFAELDAEAAAWVTRFRTAGVGRGDRTLVMVRQGLPLIASVFALFRLGAIPIVIDPGMGRKNFLACVQRSRPRALVGIPLARWFSRFFRTAFQSVEIRVPASSSLTARLTRPGQISAAAENSAVATSTSSELAAILFTSGSTGSPKGVCYEHGMFDAQVRLIRDTYAIEPGEIDLPLLPIFALFNPALGMTTIVPELDPRRPATLDAAAAVRAIQQENVTNSFGSPALWARISAHCRAKNITLPSLRRVLCAGAPVPASLWEHSHTLLPQGKLHSPYGATEALPIATISADEIDATSVRGACVGRSLRGVDVRVIGISEESIKTIVEVGRCAEGEVGEIIVRGPNVTKCYDGMPPATVRAKIGLGPTATSDDIWHRMEDCGYFDAHGRLWFCGRKAERVETPDGTLHTEPCEQVFRQHPRASRCALIGLGSRPNQRPAIVIETAVKNSAEARQLARELRVLALEHDHTAPIKIFYFRENFPVDVRHNAKIHRLTLAQWAVTAKGFESDPKR
jgi:olefin beta-lactone synthetase